MDLIRQLLWNKCDKNLQDYVNNILNNLQVENERLPDWNYNHPLLHELAHQCGLLDKIYHDNELENENQKRWNRQNKLFKLVWGHEKIKEFINNRKYIDKYGNTALERLKLNYKSWKNEELYQWVIENVF